MKIAIFDYLVTPTNPAGSCHRTLIHALANEHDFTVFSHRIENPAPMKIRWRPVKAIRRPLVVLFLTFHLAAILAYLRVRWQHGRFSLIQSIESNFAFADVVYSHFCHRWFLKHRWKACRVAGIRGVCRWLDHALHALTEPWVLRRARWIVVPSVGLKRELSSEYPSVAHKVSVIPNPIDLDAYRCPADFDRQELRLRLGIGEKEWMVVFIALGHFERKGLPLLLEALASAPNDPWKLVVVGGTQSAVSQYEKRAASLGLNGTVQFVGYQNDIRPFLWSSDLFAMPSRYESFFLAALQAAAANCPILITQLNGAEEYLNSSNAFIVTPDVQSIVDALKRFKDQSPLERKILTDRARRAVSAYGLEEFALAWRMFYRRIAQGASNA